MARGQRNSRATKVAGSFSLLAGVASAVALTGAAFFTVQQAGCGTPASYLHHDGQLELVGGCFDPADLPGKPVSPAERPGAGEDSGSFRP